MKAAKRNDNFKMLAKTFYGFEPLLARELRNLGASNVREGVRMVSFEGDLGFLYKANLCLRTALKVLKPIYSGTVFNEQQLYNAVHQLDWPSLFTADQTFAFDTTINTTAFKNSMFVALKAKDALVDKFRAMGYKRPNVDTQKAAVRIHIHIQEQHCTISLDSSGTSLHQRGYRQATNIAPINEVLAAGLLLMSEWDGRSDFLDPMCGSGTLLIEAAMIACNIPANINRDRYAFQHWSDFDKSLFEKIIEASLHKVREFHGEILGYDKAVSAIRKSQENVAHANLTEYVHISRKDFFKTTKPVTGFLHLVFNPPYGERLPIDVPTFYEKLGNTLKQGYPDSHAWFVTANLEAMKYVGLKPSRKIKVFNGALESRLLKYELYKGSKKAKFQK
ncbi:MAG: THUMP domain-containing protein [Bacteroidota bacterium]